MDTDLLESATEMLVDVVVAARLAEETVLVPTVRVNDAVSVMEREELRVSSNDDSEVQVEVVVSTTVEVDVVGKDWEELRSGIRDEDCDKDIDWTDPGVVEMEGAEEEDISEFCSSVVDEIIVAESLEVVIKLACQSVVIVVHGANEVSIDRVDDGIQVESQLVTWLVFAGGRHGAAFIFLFPSS